MKVNNETVYDTRALRSILCAVHDEMAKYEGRLASWRRVKFDIVHSRERRWSGWARRWDMRSRLRLPKPAIVAYWNPTRHHKYHASTVSDLIWLGWHEIMHLYGYDHKHGCDIPEGLTSKIAEEIGRRHEWASGDAAQFIPTVEDRQLLEAEIDDKEARKTGVEPAGGDGGVRAGGLETRRDLLPRSE